MLKGIPKILWAAVVALSLVLAGVLGTSPAVAKDGAISSGCSQEGIIGWFVYWSNDTTEDIEYVFNTGVPGEPVKSGTADALTNGAIDFGRNLTTVKDGQTYTLTITLDTVVVYQADWVNDCPWQGMSVTVDTFTAATDPSPTPTVTPTPTPSVEPTPTVEPTVVPTPTATPTATPTPSPGSVKSLKVKVKKNGKAKATWKGTATSWKAKAKIVKGKAKVKPKKATVTTQKFVFKVKAKAKKTKLKVTVTPAGGKAKSKTIKLK